MTFSTFFCGLHCYNFLDVRRRLKTVSCMRISPRAIVLMGLAFAHITVSGNWPNWRGPTSNGSTTDNGGPIKWDRTNNVAWRVALPEAGNSSPIIWEDRVFLTQAVGDRRTVLCIDRTSGKILWQSGPKYGAPELTMKDSNPYCAASPVTDGERVIAFFGSAGMYCFDFEGRQLWHADTGNISHQFGTASSPCLFGDLVFAYVGPGEKQWMVAVNKRSGQIIWRTEAPRPDAEEKAKISTNGPPVGSWSTPVIIDNGGRSEVVMSFAFRFGGFDAANGKLLWERGGLGLQTYVTPLVTDGMFIVMSGTAAHAVRPPNGPASEAEVVWTEPKGKFRFGSGVATETHVYYLSENGLAECWEKRTGKVLWQERLRGPGKKTTSWSSLSKAGDRIYAPNQSGDVFVFAAEPVFRVLSTNSVAEPTNASLALARGSVVMRTDQALWCFGTKGQTENAI
jgi:outer membrane protein assembly factor BamB